jgi:putative protein-disulfide isomerase
VSEKRILWYFADPMCSWCWGFAPVISSIIDTYQDALQLALVMGGLRPGTIEPVTQQFREEMFLHWHEVERRTGQTFTFEGAMPDGFVYDTEPASRAVVVVAELNPPARFLFLQALQAAFYVEQQDVTRAQTLVALAHEQDIDKTQFLESFESEDMKQRTQMHFDQTQQAGIRGFPAAVLQNDTGFTLLTYGYAPLDALTPKIDAWLATPAAPAS